MLEVFRGFLAVGGKPEILDLPSEGHSVTMHITCELCDREEKLILLLICVFYVFDLHHAFLIETDMFSFTSRRVDGYPFSLTIFVNRQCHVRLSTCCEAKRTVGSRLGQGSFQLIELQGALPCIR